VPDVLLSGHHEEIESWREYQSLLRTMERRPDLLNQADLTERQKKWLAQMIAQQNQ
jgi:tRNA (guanine37-N1)-methyltransferase